MIFVTARGAVADQVRGLHAGAEDYIVKPFDAAELLARVETVFAAVSQDGSPHHPGGGHRGPRARQVWKDGEEIALTPKEYDLLLLFLRNPQRRPVPGHHL